MFLSMFFHVAKIFKVYPQIVQYFPSIRCSIIDSIFAIVAGSMSEFFLGFCP